MKKAHLIKGLIAGGVPSIWLLVFPSMGMEVDGNLGMLIGFSSMFIGFLWIYFGMKEERARDEKMSFWSLFLYGMRVLLVASTVYVLTWQISYRVFIPDFATKMGERYLTEYKKTHQDPVEIEKYRQEMKSFQEMYEKPWYNILVTYSEILPFGILVTLASAGIVRKQKVWIPQ